jgi:hypothetical protein
VGVAIVLGPVLGLLGFFSVAMLGWWRAALGLVLLLVGFAWLILGSQLIAGAWAPR